MKKSILSILICIAMIISLIPFVAAADNLTPIDTQDKGLVLSKNLVPQNDGSYDLKLEAYATGKEEEGSQTANTKFDIVVAVDQSSSMATTDIGGSWNPVTKDWTIEDATGSTPYYYKVGEKYYPVKAMPGTIYEPVTAPRIWRVIGSGHDGLSAVVNGSPIHYNVPTDYYTLDNQGMPHKVYFITVGETLQYSAYPYYYTNNTGAKPVYTSASNYTNIIVNEENPYNSGNEFVHNVFWLNGYEFVKWVIGQSDSAWTAREMYKSNSRSFRNAINDSAYVESSTFFNSPQEWISMAKNQQVCFVGKSDASIASADASQLHYSWFSNGDAVNGLVLPKSGTNYNQLGYVNDNGELVQIPNSKTIYTEGSVVYQNGTLYQKIEGNERMNVLKQALSLFTHNVAADANTRDVTHNIAMVGFADNKPESYTNTELFANGTQNNYSTLNSGLYANAFIPLNENDNNGNLVNDTFDNYIGMLDTEGFTYTSYGVAMANQIFENNPIPEGDNTRQRILIIFTDGEPGSAGFDPDIAGEALADAQIAKEVYGAKVYTIGLFNGKLQTEVENFMKYITSEYSTATNNVYSSNLNATDTYFYTSTADGKTYAASAVRNGMSTLDWWIDNGDGTYIWTSPKNQRSGTQGEDQREGTVYFYTGQNSSGAVYADGSGSSAVSTSSTYYTADNKQIRYELRWYNSDGDFVDPKTSASDSNARHQQFFTIGDSTRNEDVGADEHYFLPVSNDAEIQAAFDSVTTREVPVVNIVSATELGASATLKDILSDSFDIALTNGQPEITVQTAKGTANAAGEITWDDPDESNLEAEYNNTDSTITLTGFDYKTNFIAYGKEAIENDTEANQGRKVIVTIKGLTPKKDSSGMIYSNTDTSGIYDGNDDIQAKFPRPSIDVGTPSAFVIDYSAPIKLATMTKQMKGESHNNGTFNLSNEIVSYQLATDSQADKKAVINGAYRDVDSAMVYGKPEGNNSVAWNKLITVPSSSVYFDDNLTSTITSDGYGKSSEVDDQTVSKSAGSVNGTFYFTFYGTGIDVYCTTHDKGGYVSAALYRASQESECVKDNREGTAKMIQNYSSEAYYNTPSVSFTGLTAGTYTLKIMATEDVQYKLDGIRVYNPVETGSDAANELNKTEDGNATYLNLRKVLLNDKGIGGFTVTNSIPDGAGAVDPSTVSGVLFIDDVGKIMTTSNIDKDGNISETPINLYQSQFDVYKNNGPKNEIYLNNNQAVTFQVNTEKVSADKTIYIGLSAPKTGSGSVSVTGNDPITVGSVMDMYYPITVPANGSITITNEGNSLISVTNLKITGIADLIPAATQENQDEILSATRALFKPVTMKAVRMAANDGVDPEEETVEPEQPIETEKPNVTEEPTETEKPSVTEEPAEPENPGEGSLVIDEPEETETPAPTPSVEPEKPATTGNTIQKLIQSITKSISNFFKSIFRR